MQPEKLLETAKDRQICCNLAYLLQGFTDGIHHQINLFFSGNERQAQLQCVTTIAHAKAISQHFMAASPGRFELSRHRGKGYTCRQAIVTISVICCVPFRLWIASSSTGAIALTRSNILSFSRTSKPPSGTARVGE